MFSYAVLALASIASSAHALAIPREVQPPPSYAQGYLEPYKTYHIRYLAIGCDTKHNTTFFNDCCHPMLATENLKDNRKAYCAPSPEASSSAAQAEPTSTVVPSGDDDCDDDEESTLADPVPTSAVAPPPENVAPEPTSSSDKPAPTSSKDKPAPSSSSEDKPAPSPAPKPAPSPAPAPASSGGDSDGLSGIIGKVFTGGIATFYFQNGVAGNCGTVHSDSDFIVALPSSTYDNGAHCGKQVRIKNTSTGHQEVATVADSCPTCDNANCLDMSKGLFDAFASESQGIFDISWSFI